MTDPDEKPTFIVCAAWEDRAVPSYRVPCSGCGGWLAVSKYVTDAGGFPPGAKHICLECMFRRSGEGL